MFQLLRRFWGLALVLVLAGSAPGRADTTVDPAGDYLIAGNTVAGGRDYGGRLKIVQSGPAYILGWRLDQGDAYTGVGLLEGDILGAVYWSGSKSGLGVVIYRIEGDTLTGTWAPAGAAISVAGRETLKGSSQLSGRYAITLGQNPDNGSKYTGEVEIKRTGETYELRWFTPDPSAVGRGIKVGDLLVVGYGPESPGVVAYCMTEEGGDGVWSYGESRGLGREVIAHQGADTATIAAACSGQGI
jgi:hypothetical protein